MKNNKIGKFFSFIERERNEEEREQGQRGGRKWEKKEREKGEGGRKGGKEKEKEGEGKMGKDIGGGERRKKWEWRKRRGRYKLSK